MCLDGSQTLDGASCFIAQDSRLPERARWLRGLYCEPGRRRNGEATRLMRWVIAQADAIGVAIVLHPFAGPYDGEDGPDTAGLDAWYRKLGFETLQDAPRLLLVKMPDIRRVGLSGRFLFTARNERLNNPSELR